MLDKFFSTPDYPVSKNYVANDTVLDKDLRSPGYLKLAEKELSYRLKIVVLIVLDSLALWFGWTAAYADSWYRPDFKFIWHNSEISSLFSTVLVFMLFLFSAYELYRKGDKSRNLSSSVKAVILAHLSSIPIVLRFYDPSIIYQLTIASLLTILLVTFQRLTLNWIWAYIRQKHYPLRQKNLVDR